LQRFAYSNYFFLGEFWEAGQCKNLSAMSLGIRQGDPSKKVLPSRLVVIGDRVMNCGIYSVVI